MEALGDLEAKSSEGSWETTVGVREDKWLKRKKKAAVHVQKNIFCDKWMKYNLDILGIPHNFSFHWDRQGLVQNPVNILVSLHFLSQMNWHSPQPFSVSLWDIFLSISFLVV